MLALAMVANAQNFTGLSEELLKAAVKEESEGVDSKCARYTLALLLSPKSTTRADRVLFATRVKSLGGSNIETDEDGGAYCMCGQAWYDNRTAKENDAELDTVLREIKEEIENAGFEWEEI